MSAVLTFAVLLMTLKALAIQKTDPKSGLAAKDPQQALAMAALEAIDLNEVESEKVHKTPALGDTARQAELAIEKLPRFVALCGPPPGRVDPESGAKEYCTLVRLDLESLLNKAEGVSRSASALSLDPGNNDRKEELVQAIKEYQALRAWLEARLKKWNLYKTEPAVPTKVTAVQTKNRIPYGSRAACKRVRMPIVVILDPQIVKDRSTYQHPMEASLGVEYLLVGGVMRVDKGKLIEEFFPEMRSSER